MTDRELLELAAKAAGIKGEYYIGILNDDWVSGIIYIRADGQQCVWDPINDDGDALRLAVKLKLQIIFTNATVIVHDFDGNQLYMCGFKHDPYAATRRAIVRAAAETGKESK